MSATTTIICNCNQHASIASKQSEFFDTVLIAGSNSVRIQAHRDVLCAFSEYFLEVFRARGDLQSALEGNQVELELKEIEASKLKLIIDIMYSGSIQLTPETIEGILRAAVFLKMICLIDGCNNFLLDFIDSSNCFDWFRLAHELNLPDVKEAALESTNPNFEEISTKKELLMLSENELKDLLFNDNLHSDFEENVFLALVAWINYDKPNRKHLVLQLLSMVRFQALTPKFIVNNRRSVCQTVESFKLMCNWLQWHFSPGTRSTYQQICGSEPRKMSEKLAVVYEPSGRKLTVQTYNTKSKSWSTKIIKLLPEKFYASTIVIDDKLLVIGGISMDRPREWMKSVACLDLYTSEWSDLPPMAKTEDLWDMANLNGNLCVFGSHELGNSDARDLELYNFSTRQWHDLLPPSPRSTSAQIATHNEMLYILDFEKGYLQSYDAISNVWTSKKIQNQYVHSYGFAARHGFLFIVGGLGTRTGEAVKSVKQYRLARGTWRDLAALPNTREYLKTIVLEDKIIVSDTCYVDEFCLVLDTWRTLSCLKTVYDRNKVYYMTKFTANTLCN